MANTLTEDHLLQEVAMGLDMKLLKDSEAFKLLMESLKNDALIAMADLAECPWWKFFMIRKYQNKIWRYTALKLRVEEIIQVGLTAELELRELDALEQPIRIEE